LNGGARQNDAEKSKKELRTKSKKNGLKKSSGFISKISGKLIA